MSKYWPELNVVNDSSIVAKPFLSLNESGGKGFFMTNDNNVYLGGMIWKKPYCRGGGSATCSYGGGGAVYHQVREKRFYD